MAAKKNSTLVINPPTDAGIVYVTGESHQPVVRVEINPDTGRSKMVKEVRTIVERREFPAGEAVLSKTVTGMAVHVAFLMLGDGLKNVRIHTLGDKFNVPINGTVTKKVGRTVREFAPPTRRAA